MKFSDVPQGGWFYYIGPFPPGQRDDSRGVWERCKATNGLTLLADGMLSFPLNAAKITGVMTGASADFNDRDLIRAVLPEDMSEEDWPKGGVES